MTRLLSRLFHSWSDAGTASTPPNVVVYAIGDVHGRLDLLDRLAESIDVDAAQEEAVPEIVFLGDYIDRGHDSRGVIDRVLALALGGRFRVYAVKGNHEDAVLRFIEDPSFGPAWAMHGGRETLLSYGVTPPASVASAAEWDTAHAAFMAALPPAHLSFLRNLQLTIERGDYLFVHAGLRPGVPLSEQTEQDMLWIRHEFLLHDKPFEKVVVHGHTPEPEPFLGRYRIGVDTGAYATSVLSAVKLKGTERHLLEVRGGRMSHIT